MKLYEKVRFFSSVPYAPVFQLAEKGVLKTLQCEFESHREYQNLMYKNSKNSQALQIAAKKGYLVTREGDLISYTGIKRKLRLNRNGYLYTIISGKNKKYTLFIHQYVAYWKFGDRIFNSSIEIRHLDSNRQNNKWKNIELGSRSDNQLDTPIEIRKARSKKMVEAASKVNRKLTPEQVLYIRDSHIHGRSIIRLAREFSMAKSTMSYIINRRTYKEI